MPVCLLQYSQYLKTGLVSRYFLHPTDPTHPETYTQASLKLWGGKELAGKTEKGPLWGSGVKVGWQESEDIRKKKKIRGT